MYGHSEMHTIHYLKVAGVQNVPYCDINWDGKVDSMDLDEVKDWIANPWFPESDMQHHVSVARYDVNFDGWVTEGDADIIESYVWLYQ